MIFVAELKQVQSKKLPSLDLEYQIKLVTPDSRVVDLAKLPADTLFLVEIKEDES